LQQLSIEPNSVNHSQLQELMQQIVQQQNTSFAPAASPNAASALADSLSSAGLQLDEVRSRLKYL